MAVVGCVGRVPECGYSNKLSCQSVSYLIALAEPFGSRYAFLTWAMRLRRGRDCLFSSREMKAIAALEAVTSAKIKK